MEKTTILLIEDDNAFNALLTHFLKRNEYDVIPAFSANEALTLLQKNKVSIILSDMRLPDEDGITLLKKLKATSNTIPFVLMTAYADVPTAVEAMKHGASDYISKPFVPEEVLLVLKKINSKTTTEKTKEKVTAKVTETKIEDNS
nr:response regulator [Flavobacterium sp.]